jgi:biotin transport system substrate-specific component
MTPRHLLVVAAGCLALIAGARLGFPLPGTDVPQTGQTLAVLLVGALAGPVPGTAAVAVYLLAGVAGLPVFADGGSGIDAVTGPTGGFLVTFLPAAAAAGHLTRRLVTAPGSRWRRGALLWLALAGCHALILLGGWLRLSLLLGPADAFAAGVAPFLYGAAAKSLAATLMVVAVTPALRSDTPHRVASRSNSSG